MIKRQNITKKRSDISLSLIGCEEKQNGDKDEESQHTEVCFWRHR